MEVLCIRLMQFSFTLSIFKETMMLIARGTESNHLILGSKDKTASNDTMRTARDLRLKQNIF